MVLQGVGNDSPPVHWLDRAGSQVLALADMCGGLAALGGRVTAPSTWGWGPSLDDVHVMTIPGFLTGDSSLELMRLSLRAHGATTYRSGVMVNVGDVRSTLALVGDNLRRNWAQNGRHPIVLVGHSLGGLIALAVAHAHPQMVAGVVTLGTPMSFQAARPAARSAAEKLLQNTNVLERAAVRRLPPHIAVHSIISPNDFIIHQSQAVAPGAVVHETSDTHMGMVFGADTLEETVRALASMRR